MLAEVCFNKLFVVGFFVDGVGFICILSSNDLFGALSYFSKRHSAKVFGVSDGGHGLGAKVSTTSLFQQMKCVGRNYTILL